ncbi:ribonuclease [Streptomyces sp. NBC_01218]|uniref:ribonuclease domain-containing protein n=1 Tax=unclassified Streptomyces TaxID=2593676 RepID=UPI0023B94F19|nr:MULTISPECIES: ribonuclease domain-containing protein [unclassified Streptomyces]WEH38901.1 ribonuclease domain-containing protein [Streptomyces sp. AM 2-1-1]WSQ50564.1 ribonuclease [Streptomyces sp. NBC_01218]
MRIPPRVITLGGSAALLSALLVGAPASAAVADPTPTSAAAYASSPAYAAPAPLSAAVGSICSSDLPSQAHDTLALIDAGGPFPYSQDGVVFQNREGVLPSRASGYYHEYTVITPGSSTRGARRIVTGSAVEDFYTADHYVTFDLVDHGC